MRNDSHNTLIGTIRAAVTEWKRRERWSQASVVQEIVAKHDEIGAPTMTGIIFDPQTHDTYQRAKVNSDRVSRWLDDETKDNNLLPVNFVPSILAALPADLQLQVMTALARPLGLEVRGAEHVEAPAFDAAVHCSRIVKETSEAVQQILSLGPDASAAEREKARKEIADARLVLFEAERGLNGMAEKG